MVGEHDSWWRSRQSSLWHRTFQKVRDQPGGPRQLTAAAFPSLLRMEEMVNGEDSRKEGRLGNGMKMSTGTSLSFGIPILLSSLWIMPHMWVKREYRGIERGRAGSWRKKGSGFVIEVHSEVFWSHEGLLIYHHHQILNSYIFHWETNTHNKLS